MNAEIVKKTEIGRIKGRPKYSEKYEAWFSQVSELKDDEALKIVLGKKSTGSLPSPAALRFAVERWNLDYPAKRIGKVWRNSRTDEPILYLFREKQEEGLRRKKSRKALS